jgi:predicted nucleic acid-binding protein
VYLVDTNILSIAAPSRREPSAGLVAWMERHSRVLYLPVITIAEVEAGIAKAEREGAARKAKELSAWLDTVLHLYGDRVLPFDAETARVAGRLADLSRSFGRPLGLADIMIAATAKVRSLTVLTRNLKHFDPLGVPALDPSARV